MKRISVFFALALLFLAQSLFASAVATSVTGTVQVQSGTGAVRTLRQGDEVVQGDTVTTLANSSIVLKFDDGQVAALTGNSRMTVTAYQFNTQARTGNVLLSLVEGGMRAITGLIGRNSPERVSYRAATATIGIRGTDVTIVTARGDVVVTVTSGEISFTFRNRTITIKAGEGVDARTDGTFQHAAAEQILRNLPPHIARLIGGIQGLTNAINQARPGEPRIGRPQAGPGTPQGGGNNNVGGGSASPS